MKKIFLITGLCTTCIVQAEPRTLPPIINNSTYASGAPYSGGMAANKSMLEMLGRVESLQTDIQQLRGQVEQQTHEIDNLKKRQQNMYTDIDLRLQQLEKVNGIASTVSESENLLGPAGEEKLISPVRQTQSPESKAAEKAAFEKGFASVKNQHNHQAIKLFKQFLLDYPAGDYSDNATFWLASVYKVVDDLPNAKANFQAVYTQFPKSEKAGLAMLKLADIYFEENNQRKAKQLYTQVTTQYENSSAANIATKKLQNIGQ